MDGQIKVDRQIDVSRPPLARREQRGRLTAFMPVSAVPDDPNRAPPPPGGRAAGYVAGGGQGFSAVGRGRPSAVRPGRIPLLFTSRRNSVCAPAGARSRDRRPPPATDLLLRSALRDHRCAAAAGGG